MIELCKVELRMSPPPITRVCNTPTQHGQEVAIERADSTHYHKGFQGGHSFAM